MHDLPEENASDKIGLAVRSSSRINRLSKNASKVSGGGVFLNRAAAPILEDKLRRLATHLPRRVHETRKEDQPTDRLDWIDGMLGWLVAFQ